MAKNSIHQGRIAAALAEIADDRRRLIRSITLRNLLSFGPHTPELELGSLNVLIGPNGSGKSNLLEAVALLRSTPGEIRPVLLKGGGAAEWIWKGKPRSPASLEVVVSSPGAERGAIRHSISFFVGGQQDFWIFDENLGEARGPGQLDRSYDLYRYKLGTPALIRVDSTGQMLRDDKVGSDRSILSQRRDPNQFPEITHLAEAYERIRLYREWTFGRDTVLRQPQKADMRNDRLEQDFSNLGLFLSRLRRSPKTKKALLDHLQDLYEGLSDFEVVIEGGTVQVFFTEGEFFVPATRLSDGTVRYLCLLAILLDPEPPPLIGIEEPEVGLHPDLIPKIAELLVEASKRTQLIVTTHSDTLVDALTERPESVIVCEKHNGATVMQRLDAKKLQPWLSKYRLGDLWTKGEIGGNRW
jgi:predicted ATPase